MRIQTHLLLRVKLGLPTSLLESARGGLGLAGVIGELEIKEGVLEAVGGGHPPRRHHGVRQDAAVSRDPRRARAWDGAPGLFVVDESQHLGQRSSQE